MSSQNPSSSSQPTKEDLAATMAKRQQRAVEKRALQQRRRVEAERLAKQQADLEEQRRKLLEYPELSDEDQDLGQDL